MTTTQRVDVERLSELLAVMASSDPNRMTEFPGGCDCYECGNIFIGGAGHDYCAQCEAKRQLLVMLPEVLPALLQQLAERDAEVERLDAERKQHLLQALENGAAFHAAERARDESEQDRWRTDWPEMTPVSDAHPGIWQSERVIVSLVGGRVTHDVAESFDGQRPLWFIHRDKVRAWQPFPAAVLAANGGRDHA